MLKYIKDSYGDPEIIVTENGVSDKDAAIEDDHRIYFYTHYIDEALKGRVEPLCFPSIAFRR